MIAPPSIAQSTASQRPAYPQKPVRLLVGFAPGGGTDILARVLAQRLSGALGEQFVVENRPGANGNVAAELVSKAPADGHVLLTMSVQYAIGKVLYRKLAYDLERDLVAVSDIAVVPQVVAVHPSLPARSVKELVGLARARPGQLTYASSGNGSVEQMAGEMLKTAARIDMTHVPYKGGGPAAIDLVAGHVFVAFGTMPALLQFIRDGRIRAIAVTPASRVAVLPDVPTVAESGYPGYAMSTWYGIMAPAGTPAQVIALLNAEIVRALGVPDVKERFLAVGAEPLGRMNPAAFGAYIRSEIAKYAKVVQDNNLKVD